MNAAAPPLWEQLLPVYDVSDELSVVVNADQAGTWNALMNVDFIAVGKRHPLAGLLGAVRMLPELVAHAVRSRHDDEAHDELETVESEKPQKLLLKDLIGADMGGDGTWVALGERPGSEIALGLVGKFWKPVIEYAAVTSETFATFDTPGYAKTVYAFRASPIDESHTSLTAVMRTATTDAHARRWFRRYWMLGVESGAHVLVNGLLEMVAADAEVAAVVAANDA